MRADFLLSSTRQIGRAASGTRRLPRRGVTLLEVLISIFVAAVGLLGELRMIALVRGVMAAAMRPRSGWKLSSDSTSTMRPAWFSI